MDLARAVNTAAESLGAKRLREADRLCAEILEAYPDQPNALHILGEAAHQLGLSGAGVALVRRALSQACDQPHLHTTLAQMLFMLGRDDEALAALGNAIALVSDNPEISKQLQSLYDELAASRNGQNAASRQSEAAAQLCEIPEVSANDVVDPTRTIHLTNLHFAHGHPSWNELVVLCSLCRKFDPKLILEIGTFDGNTTLHFALNSPDTAKVLTLDLPPDVLEGKGTSRGDRSLTSSPLRSVRRFIGTEFEEKITQFYGDSLEFDFSKFLEHGHPDFIFIDAGHTYDCVKSDTEKALSIIKSGGHIVWHDYHPGTQGVVIYLNEISQFYDLKHVSGTAIVVGQF